MDNKSGRNKKNRKKPPSAGGRAIFGMPAPVGWGDKPRPSSGRGVFRLERGRVRLDRIPLRLIPEAKKELPPVEDKLIGKLPPTLQRPILPVDEELGERETRPRSGEPGEIIEFEYWEEADTIRDALVEQVKSLSFGLFICGVVTVFLALVEAMPLFLEQVPDMFSPERGPISYLALNIILCMFCVAFSWRTFTAGFRSVKARKPHGSAVFSFASAAVIAHMLALLVMCVFVTRGGTGRVLGAPLAFGFFINTLGELVMERRIARGFSFVSTRKLRHAAMRVSEQPELSDLLNDNGRRNNRMVYSCRAKFLSGYMNFALEEDLGEHMMNRVSPYAAVVALVVGLAAGLVTRDPRAGGYCAAAMLAIGSPVCRILCINAPLGRAVKRLLEKGVMLNGWAAVDEFHVVQTLVVSSDMLFPKGTVKLTAVKPIGERPLEQTLLAAGAVVLAAGGPLARAFAELLQGRDDIPEAESVEYESELGVAGFVDSETILAGNRQMLKFHGCEVPSDDFEGRMKKSSRDRVVYIAIGGHLAAVMAVRYSVGGETVHSIRRLLEQNISLMVYTCDPNITAAMLAKTYGVPAKMISIMSVPAGAVYDELTHTIQRECLAVMATNGKLSSLANGLSECVRLKGLLGFSAILQLACFAVGLTLIAVIACMGGVDDITPLRLMLVQGVCLLAAVFPAALS